MPPRRPPLHLVDDPAPMPRAIGAPTGTPPTPTITPPPTSGSQPGAQPAAQPVAQPVAAAAKILSRDALLAARARAKAEGRSVVQCHGCFDIVHPGHLRHLRHAKSQGDILLVTITGDSMINKGTGRPLIPQELRAENLAALDCVDWVYIEPRPTALELLEDVRPDIYVKGREYELNADPRFQAERDAVIRHGGRVVFSSGDVVFSSTALIAALEHSVDPYHARLQQLLARAELAGERLSTLINAFRGKRVVVLGEAILDTYVLCDRPDVAGESPVMTLRPIEHRTYDGGAAVIARHLAALGAIPTLVTALDDSDAARALRQRLLAEGVSVRHVRCTRPIPEKQRFLVGTQKVMKLDLVERLEPEARDADLLLGALDDALNDAGRAADACIIADFGLGMLSPGVLARACAAARAKAGVVAGDVSGKRSGLLGMRDLDLLCPSESELREATRLFDQSLPMVAWNLLSQTGSRRAIVTMGADGLVAFDRLDAAPAPRAEWTSRLKAEHVPAISTLAIDPLGCGDALMSVATLALASGGSMIEAAFLGAVAAGVQVQRLGNTVVAAADIRHGVARVHSAHLAFAPSEVVAARSPRAAPDWTDTPPVLVPIASPV